MPFHMLNDVVFFITIVIITHISLFVPPDGIMFKTPRKYIHEKHTQHGSSL